MLSKHFLHLLQSVLYLEFSEPHTTSFGLFKANEKELYFLTMFLW